MWADLAATCNLDVYFCDPHAPWQRGLNEHTNRLLRWWLPKGADLSVHNPSDLAAILNVLNHEPRRSLNWGTPAERYAALSVH